MSPLIKLSTRSRWTSYSQRFWDTDKNCMVSCYFKSVFVGHTKALDLLKSFLKGLASLDQANMVQVFMNEPSTNWIF